MPAAILLALMLSLLTSTLLFFLSSFKHVNNTTLALFFLLPVGISASLWGLMPGIIAAFSSFLAFNFFFIPNLYTFQVKQTEDLIVLVAFLGVASVISELTGRMRRNLASATAREYEAKQLYEFILLLSSAQDITTAARIILEKIEQTFLPERVEILIEGSPHPVLISTGVSKKIIPKKKPFLIPLQSVRGLIGEIRFWSKTPILDTEERILKIFANQSVLTIERIKLGEDVQKNKVLEESDRLKSSLLSSVSHELRSPLAAIKASISSLRSDEVDWDSDARKELMITVEEEIDHLNILVGNLLDMSRIEAGVFKPQQKPNILTEIISAITGRMHSQIQNYNVKVTVSEDLPMVNVDFVQMQQVFTNLLTNSLKYSPVKSLIEINAIQNEPDFLLVTLKNQSMPLPETDMERIFDKFYRINPTDRITGSGLGLSICKGIIEAHGGHIWAENLSDGLAFKFTLPICKYD
ncbi:MAG: DUF4118 domain-containing protein [Chloroflexota bacterium]